MNVEHASTVAVGSLSTYDVRKLHSATGKCSVVAIRTSVILHDLQYACSTCMCMYGGVVRERGRESE